MLDAADLRLRQWAHDQSTPVISRRQALCLGFTDRMIKRRTDLGWWRRIKPGVFDVSGQPDDWRSTLAAVVSALPAVASHHTAAQLHGFPGTPRGRVVVTVPHRTTHLYPGVEVHQSTDLVADYVGTVDGIPTTTPERTVVDLAACHRLAFMVGLVERLIVANRLSLNGLLRVAGQLGRRGRPGTVMMRQVIEAVAPDVDLLDSELERIVLDLIRSAGLALPELQRPIPWRTSRPGRLDMVYMPGRLIIECDGRLWHTAAQVFEDDRRRDNEATVAGWRVIRVTWKMINEHPHEFVALLRGALAA